MKNININMFEDKKYNIIYADPPWQYNIRNNKHTKFGGGASGHYPLMKLDDIWNLPVKQLANDNCALFLWVTFPYLDKQILTIEKWGFKYKTVAFTWIKINKNDKKPFFGVGYYTKSNAEICLLGIKGKMKPISNKISSVIIAPRQEHSRKPDEAKIRIVELFGDLPKIELFARNITKGWDVWGNEINKFYNQNMFDF